MNKMLLLAPLALVMASCASGEKKVIVDISDKNLKVVQGAVPIFSVPVQTGRGGIDDKIGSNGTPLGEYTLIKEPKHRYGPALRLSGYQGYSRGILLHEDKMKVDWTHGCICPPKREDMIKIMDLIDEETPLEIRA